MKLKDLMNESKESKIVRGGETDVDHIKKALGGFKMADYQGDAVEVFPEDNETLDKLFKRINVALDAYTDKDLSNVEISE